MSDPPGIPMLAVAVTGTSRAPLKATSDVRLEAVAFMGLLRCKEDRLEENARTLLKKDREFFLKVFTVNLDEWTLMHACTLKGVRKLVKMALKAGVDPNVEMGFPEGLPGRCTPLHLAAHRGDVSIIQLLVEFGAQVNKRDETNCTPLHYALQRGNTLAAKKLLKFGADHSELSREERIYFKNEISSKGPALLCVPVRVGSLKHRHNSSLSKIKILTSSSSCKDETSTTSSSLKDKLSTNSTSFKDKRLTNSSSFEDKTSTDSSLFKDKTLTNSSSFEDKTSTNSSSFKDKTSTSSSF